ncbi:unnamed protein product [Ectocarpus sp. 12 AP-2014]
MTTKRCNDATTMKFGLSRKASDHKSRRIAVYHVLTKENRILLPYLGMRAHPTKDSPRPPNNSRFRDQETVGYLASSPTLGFAKPTATVCMALQHHGPPRQTPTHPKPSEGERNGGHPPAFDRARHPHATRSQTLKYIPRQQE